MGEGGVVVDSRGYELLVCCSGGSRVGVSNLKRKRTEARR
jgi:hypothetical protein